MVSGPEMSRIINDFELCQELLKKSQNGERELRQRDFRDHEQLRGVPITFQKQVKSLCNTTEEMGNPFLEQSGYLLVLDTRDIMDTRVVETVRTIEKVGKEQYQEFAAKKLEERKTPLFDPIKRNKLPLFGSPPLSKQKSQEKCTSHH